MNKYIVMNGDVFVGCFVGLIINFLGGIIMIVNLFVLIVVEL